MANRAVAMVGGSILIAAHGVTSPEWYYCNTADTIFAGYLVQYQDAKSVIVNDTTVSTEILGVAGLPDYKDNTEAYAANERTPVWHCGCGAVVWAVTDGHASEAWNNGEFVTGSDQTAGLCELDPANLDAMSCGRVWMGFADVSGTKKNFKLVLNV